jgi:hypothetical protein
MNWRPVEQIPAPTRIDNADAPPKKVSFGAPSFSRFDFVLPEKNGTI